MKHIIFLFATLLTVSAQSAYKVQTRYPIAGTEGWDYVTLDVAARRLYVSHSSQVEVLDAGDSGIFLRGSGKSQINIWCWPVGSGEVWGYRLDKNLPGEIRAALTPKVRADKPVGEWNEAEIKSLNGKLDLYLNGENVVSTTMWDDNWKKLVAGSKFKDWKDFAAFKKGKICLQEHGNTVWYRNIRIKKL